MKLIHCTLDPSEIFNWMAPFNVTAWNVFPKELKKRWWDEDVQQLREQFEQKWIEKYDFLTGHFTKLRQSMEKEGMLNSISCVSGPIRDVHLKSKVSDQRMVDPFFDINKLIYTHPFGGSRVIIAKELNIKVPCIVYDFAGLFSECLHITHLNYRTFFDSTYKYVHSLPNIRCTIMNIDTRKNQHIATKYAKKECLDV